MNVKFYIRQTVKLAAREVFLPMLYRIACLRHRHVDRRLVVLADAHHSVLPDSMVEIREELIRRGYRVEVLTEDYQRSSASRVLRQIAAFMDLYARAGTVFLCDYYLPAVSCRKRQETRLVQLWHACGSFKKFGYDASDDIPAGFSRNMFRNLDLVTVSGESAACHYAEAFHIPQERVEATGISRTDKYFRESYRQECREEFFRLVPEAEGKRVLLWAPTFRGNAAVAKLAGYEEIMGLVHRLGEEWYPVIKLHPHMEGKVEVPHIRLPIEKLLPAADVLITDFSSVIFEGSLFGIPMYLYAPDAGEYDRLRGVYPEAKKAMEHMLSAEELEQQILRDVEAAESPWLEEPLYRFCREQMSSCDGRATERILEKLKLSPLRG